MGAGAHKIERVGMGHGTGGAGRGQVMGFLNEARQNKHQPASRGAAAG